MLSFMAAVVLLWTWHVRRELRRSRVLLERWAAEGRRTIVSAERTQIFLNPTVWDVPGSGWSTGGTGRSTFRVEAEEPDGRRHSGRVTLGGSWWGIRDPSVDVIWD